MDSSSEYSDCKVKDWLFRENIRLAEERDRLEAEREAFEKEKRETLRDIELQQTKCNIAAKQIEMKQNLVDSKLAVIEKEYERLNDEKRRLEQEKASIAKSRKYAQQATSKLSFGGMDMLFKGVDNELSLKKRYRQLLKIFHPDNLGGDNSIIQSINTHYEYLKKRI